jgi:hypothetical protein
MSNFTEFNPNQGEIEHYVESLNTDQKKGKWVKKWTRIN